MVALNAFMNSHNKQRNNEIIDILRTATKYCLNYRLPNNTL